MITVAMLLMATPSTNAARPPMVSRNPTVNGTVQTGPERSVGVRSARGGRRESTVAEASVPAAGSTARGSGEEVPSVMDTL